MGWKILLSWLLLRAKESLPLENEYYTVACGKVGALYSFELVKGREIIPQFGKEFSPIEKTLSLL